QSSYAATCSDPVPPARGGAGRDEYVHAGQVVGGLLWTREGGDMAVVLVVEDDATIRETIAYNLQRDGHEVLTAEDGVRGLEAAREHRPDLLVLDVMMPRMSGLDVLRIIREEMPVPVLLLTARDAEADVVQGLEMGAD